MPGRASSGTSLDFRDPCVYGTSNSSKHKFMWQCVITSKCQARLAGEQGEVVRSQSGVCLTGSETVKGVGYQSDWESQPTAWETVGFGG